MWSQINIFELSAFILYFLLMLLIGFWFMLRPGSGGASDYFLGDRKMGPWVTAMSAQASDMSGWLLMGLPGSILALGLGEVWIAIGLAIGTYLNWLFVAARLRRFTKAADDAITLPEYLTKRFKSKSVALQIISAAVFFFFFTIYVASGFKAGGTLFSSVMGISESTAMIVFAFIVIMYTFMGGFSAVCWTDFVQGMLMFFAILIVPIIVYMTKSSTFTTIDAPNYFNLMPSGQLDWSSISTILSGLAWGLGYFGMPHIIVRFMAIENSKMIKKSRLIAMVWVICTLSAAAFIGIIGRMYMPGLAENGQERVFIEMVRSIFPGFISGILLSAILAAAMSTADSQLLVASSSITNDIYIPVFRKNATNKEILWVGRITVIALSIVAYILAVNPNSGNIMGLVSNAWAGFGASFGPVIILTLYWKRFTYRGAVAGIVGGAATVVLWIQFMSFTGLYELLPGFVVGFAASVLVTLLDKEPSEEICDIYDRALDMSIDD